MFGLCMQQELLTPPEHLSAPTVLVKFVLLDVLCVCFIDRCLSFCSFSFGHCVVCRFTDFDYPFGILKLFLNLFKVRYIQDSGLLRVRFRQVPLHLYERFNIQLMTFHEVNTRIDQPMEHDIHRDIRGEYHVPWVDQSLYSSKFKVINCLVIRH